MHELAADTFIKATLTHAHNGYKGKVEKSRRSEELILLVHAQEEIKIVKDDVWGFGVIDLEFHSPCLMQLVVFKAP